MKDKTRKVLMDFVLVAAAAVILMMFAKSAIGLVHSVPSKTTKSVPLATYYCQKCGHKMEVYVWGKQE